MYKNYARMCTKLCQNVYKNVLECVQKCARMCTKLCQKNIHILHQQAVKLANAAASISGLAAQNASPAGSPAERTSTPSAFHLLRYGYLQCGETDCAVTLAYAPL